MYGHISLNTLTFPLHLYDICMNDMLSVSVERIYISLTYPSSILSLEL